MIDSFLAMAALAGIGVAAVAGPLGAFVVWRRMAYFGDATAHAAILGVALAIATDWPIIFGVLVVAVAMAVGVAFLGERGHAADTALGVASHGALAFGLVAVSMGDGPQRDLLGFLFGDILTVQPIDLVVIWSGAVVVVGVVSWRWSPLLMATLNPELARAAGIDPRKERILLNLALALVVAVSLKVVGALLIAAMLIIPAAAARPLARTPEMMALCATAIASAAVLGGLGASVTLDSPTGPTIVATAAVIFGLTNLWASLRGTG